jgi:hypothetical protein
VRKQKEGELFLEEVLFAVKFYPEVVVFQLALAFLEYKTQNLFCQISCLPAGRLATNLIMN